MKIVVRDDRTLIYPFLQPDELPTVLTGCIIIYKTGAIRLDELDAMMDAGAARTLAQALLHAVEVAEKGQK
jgi:hypothetical protein